MSLALLDEADVVVTNPPFSLFREFVGLLVKKKKEFLIIGNKNAITNKEFFPLLKDDKVWIGWNNVKGFVRTDKTIQKFGNIGWFTNLDHAKRHMMLPLDLGYVYEGHEDMYPKYDNYDAINVDKVEQIPCDYMGVMGVPITFLDKYCPEQFEIVWQASGNTRACCPTIILNNDLHYIIHPEDRGGCGVTNGSRQYSRILIRRKKEINEL
jgi:hypothetical protein